MKFSINNQLIVTPYVKKALEKEVKGGLARVAQASAHVGFKLIIDAKLLDGTFLKAGTIAYVKEHRVHTNQVLKAWEPQHSAAIPEPFVVIPYAEVEFLDTVE